MKRMVAVVGCALLAVSAWSADAIGKWNVKMDYQGNPIESVMTISKQDDGSLKGVWTGRRGEDELKNLKFEGDALSFTRTIEMQGQSFDLTFSGKVEGDTINGKFDTAMGEMIVTGAREAAVAAAAPAGGGGLDALAGDWNAHVSSGLGEFDHVLRFKNDGTGVYDGGDAKYDLTNVAVADGKVTFDMTIDVQGTALPLKFAGTLDGTNLKGEFISDQGNGTVEAVKAGAAVAAAATPGFPGVWDIVSESQLGTLNRVLTVKDDLTGTYKTDAAEFPLENVKVDGNNVTFSVTVDVQGNQLPLAFTGTMDGSNLTGEFKTEAGNATVKGTKQAAAAAAPSSLNPEVAEFVNQVMAALKAQDVDAMMKFYAEDFKSDTGGKTEFTEFMVGAKDQGFLEGIEIDMAAAEGTLDGDKATVKGVGLEGAFGVLTLELELQKRDGKWIITHQTQY